jgi:cAMP-specific phosphodiesterase 4/calcium/calmodulin-dependent 3',5'-cyclic nucleotide phosphodiesterase
MKKWHHPPSFYCPISQQCMHDPVVLSDGHTYERQYIERWLEQHHTSPVSGLHLHEKGTFPNHALRNAIEEYFQEVFSVHRRAIRKATRNNDRLCDLPEQDAPDGTQSEPLLRTIDALVQCSLLMNSDLSTECVLRRIMNEAKALVGAEVASVFIVDSDRQELYSTVNSTEGEIRIPITAGIAGHVATTGEAVVIKDAYNDARFNKKVDLKTGFKTRNIMCVPLKAKKGAVIGVVQLINKVTADSSPTVSTCCSSFAMGSSSPGSASQQLQQSSFTEDDKHFLEVFASQAATAVASSRIEPFQYEPVSRKNSRRASWSGPFSGDADSIQKATLTGDGTEVDGPIKSQAWAEQKVDSPDEAVQEKASTSLAALDDLTASSIEQPVEQQSETEIASTIEQAVEQQSEIRCLLTDALDSWQLDTLALAAVTDNRPLSTLGMHLFDNLGLIEHYELDSEKLLNFFVEIERGYDDAVGYHNRSHAAGVMHAMYALLHRGGVASACANAIGDDVDDGKRMVMMAGLLAAALHDYEHLGLNNDFLIKTKHARALLYNDQHVNENHHISAAFAVLQRPACNFLSNFKEYPRLRSLIIELVLGTDMANHGNLVKSLSEQLNGSSAAAAAPLSKKNAVLLLQSAMKCADLGHLALDWSLHLKWVERLEAEFFAQGDREKQLGLPVSFLMDREKPGASKSQIGFFDFVVLPLFTGLAQAAPAAADMLFTVNRNYKQWRDLEGVDGGNAGSREPVPELLSQASSSSLSSEEAVSSEPQEGDNSTEVAASTIRKRSGRARQRAAKWWASVRQRTPSPCAR